MIHKIRTHVNSIRIYTTTPLCKVEFKTLLVCISIAENTMRTPSSDNMDLHKDMVAIIQFLSYLFHRGTSEGVFERLKSRPSENWRKTKSTAKEVGLPDCH
jgi:hypothetical protein